MDVICCDLCKGATYTGLTVFFSLHQTVMANFFEVQGFPHHLSKEHQS